MYIARRHHSITEGESEVKGVFGMVFFCRCRARLKLRRSSILLVLIGDSLVREKR